MNTLKYRSDRSPKYHLIDGDRVQKTDVPLPMYSLPSHSLLFVFLYKTIEFQKHKTIMHNEKCKRKNLKNVHISRFL